MLSVFLNNSSRYILRQYLSQKLETIDWLDWLTSESLAPPIPASPALGLQGQAAAAASDDVVGLN